MRDAAEPLVSEAQLASPVMFLPPRGGRSTDAAGGHSTISFCPIAEPQQPFTSPGSVGVQRAVAGGLEVSPPAAASAPTVRTHIPSVAQILLVTIGNSLPS